ncbi:unnamed protein product [Urochloa humidicola]
MQRPPPFHAPRTALAAAAAKAAAFDSHPSDVVLIKSYLHPWVSSGVRPHGAFVHAADLYAAEPAHLARRHRAAVARDGERAWYFLSPLRTKSPRGRRKCRTVADGAGWWHGEGGPRAVVDPLDGRRRVGYRQSFSYMRRAEDGAAVRTGWIMVELRLHDDDGEDGNGGGRGGSMEDQLEGLVLCKVYRSPRHPDTAAANDADEEEESCAAAAEVETVAAPLAVAAAVAGGKRKAEDDEGSSAATPTRRHIKNAGGENSSVAAAAAQGVKKPPAAADEEVEISGATTDAARGDGEWKKAAEDDGEDSSASTPARKRAKAHGGETSSGAAVAAAAGAPRLEVAPAAPALQRKVVGFPMPQQLLCPQCGFHIGALQAVVAPARTTPETAGIARAAAPAPQGGGRTGDASGKENDPSTHRLLLRFSDPKQA